MELDNFYFKLSLKTEPIIDDTTLRDGIQMPGLAVGPEDSAKIAQLLRARLFKKIRNKIILKASSFIVFGGYFLYLLQPLWFTLVVWVFRGYYEVSPELPFGTSIHEWLWFLPFYFLIAISGSWMIQKGYNWTWKLIHRKVPESYVF
jgi:hypothetical protein